MDDDLNTADAISAVFELITDINKDVAAGMNKKEAEIPQQNTKQMIPSQIGTKKDTENENLIFDVIHQDQIDDNWDLRVDPPFMQQNLFPQNQFSGISYPQDSQNQIQGYSCDANQNQNFKNFQTVEEHQNYYNYEFTQKNINRNFSKKK